LKSFEKGEAYKRRVDWMPMYSKPTKKDPAFISKLTTPEALKYWLKLIIEAYARLHKNKGFTESKIVKDFNEEYHSMNNNVIEFLENKKPAHFLGKKLLEAHQEYEIWAEEHGLNVHGKKLFQESMKKMMKLEYKKSNGERRFKMIDEE
jgi:putative DNA primase/helicase